MRNKKQGTKTNCRAPMEGVCDKESIKEVNAVKERIPVAFTGNACGRNV